MKNLFTIFTFSLFINISGLYGQAVSDSVSVNAGYSHQSYYSLSAGEVSNVISNNWDLAFDASGYGSSIRINAALGTELYQYPSGDTNNWATLDTTGILSWPKHYNDDASWSKGAFNQTSDGSLDQGWGDYSMITHHITGDSLYVIKLSSGNWKKIWVQKLASGTYSFKHANIDGTGEINASVQKSSFAGKNFAYYSLENDTLIDREPDNTTWDLVFTKYVSEVAPGMPYGVTGILSNSGVELSKAENLTTPKTYSNHSAHTFLTEINIIGYDWKTFNMNTYQYDLDTSSCYFVKDVDGDIWRMVFTGFGGSSTGKFYFEKENLSSVSSSNVYGSSNNDGLVLYPNPANENVNIIYNSNKPNSRLIIFDISGRVINSISLEENGLNNLSIDLSNYEKGLYLIEFISGDNKTRHKLVVN